jgi:hypothetical protein
VLDLTVANPAAPKYRREPWQAHTVAGAAAEARDRAKVAKYAASTDPNITAQWPKVYYTLAFEATGRAGAGLAAFWTDFSSAVGASASALTAAALAQEQDTRGGTPREPPRHAYALRSQTRTRPAEAAAEAEAEAEREDPAEAGAGAEAQTLAPRPRPAVPSRPLRRPPPRHSPIDAFLRDASPLFAKSLARALACHVRMVSAPRVGSPRS